MDVTELDGPDLSIPPEDLPALALSRPRIALALARSHAVPGADPWTLSFALQAAGIVLRDAGETTAAIIELRQAVRAAEATGAAARVADVRATLGAALVKAGRTQAGLGQLDAAADASHGDALARVRLRRAHVLAGLGRHEAALEDLRRAVATFRAGRDRMWEARALSNRSEIHVARGSLARAERDARRAETLFRAAGQELEATYALHNCGIVTYCQGDIPGALAIFDEVDRRYTALGVNEPELAFDRCRTLLAAGLTPEAVSIVDEELGRGTATPVRRAELMYVGATASLADGDHRRALSQAREARRLFRQQGRDWWEARADLVALQARLLRGDRGSELSGLAGELADRLVMLRADEAPLALVLAGRLTGTGRADRTPDFFVAAARYRRRTSALVRATGWLGQALARETVGDSRGVFSACARGLDALDEHRATLGSSELRALATGHGQDLASLVVRQAIRSGGPRRLLAWSERWRATTLAEPPVRPPKDSARAGRLGALRSYALRLDEARLEDDPTAAERERRAWERALRHERHLLAGTGRRASAQLDIAGLVDDLADTTLLELLEVDRALHLLTVHSGRVRVRSIGHVDAALQALVAARFVLRQSARGRPTSAAGVGERLQDALLGGAVPGDGPVVVAPPSRLHAVPWALLPAFSDRPVSVVPSALMWQRARSRVPYADGRTVLIAGPGLGTGGAEVDALARTIPGATLLRDGAATVEATLAALDGAALAHVAAHGDFRPDSPMFSSLVLDDGPLTVHDLELLDHAPHRLVLSACDSGVSVPVGADELLGLTSALLSLGTAGVLASVAEVNDEATVPFMLDVHQALASGAGLPAALLEARRKAAGDDLAEATAAAFVALGV